ncbi:vascular cell adhesion protein 1 isoform X2 [Tachyglossus aculeatus]|uniref:vascular cell adhesion protein 1 isoform X2 n=1 Tax=Tachyglossus aculeatus TaxID=9261 RepID=UPI0018F3242B|nr:vascular cell adhesion protein 1 isoform X2 [Tachyglossus aculeatus]
MAGKRVGLALATEAILLVLVTSESFKVEITPGPRIAAQIGNVTVLTCIATGCAAPSFSWRTQIDSPLGGEVEPGAKKSILTMNPVDFKNEHSYLCTAFCENKKMERAVQVELYSFPQDPVITMSDFLEVGKPATITCQVPQVYPSERLKIELLKDGHIIESKEFFMDEEKKSLETKSLEVTITPTILDIGQSITCLAELPIDDMEFLPKLRKTTQKLPINTAPKNTVVSITPSNVVQAGDYVKMTCSSEGLPAPEISWSKKRRDGNLEILSHNATLILNAAMTTDSGLYVCEGTNRVGKDKKEVELIVQDESFKAEILERPKITAQIGNLTVLTCSVTGCPNPSFSWRTQTDSPLEGKVKNEDTRSTLTMSPVGFKNEHSYLCTAFCGTRKMESDIQVELYSFPHDPVITMSDFLEVGKPATITCQVPQVYPSERLKIELLKDGYSIESKEFFMDEEKKSLETKSLEVTITPTTLDIGQSISCQAELPIDDMEFLPKLRLTTRRLNIGIAPRNTVISGAPTTTVQEGDYVTVSCSSEGLPAPEISWSKRLDNGDLEFLSQNATLTFNATVTENSGIYVCEGSNQAGKERKEVELIVQVPPKDTVLVAFPSNSVKEGDTVTISCTSVGVSPSQIVLRKKADPGEQVLESRNGHYTIHAARLEDAGIYECESKTEVGRQLRSLNLDVKGRENHIDYFSPELVALYCVASLIIPSVGMIIFLVRKANVKGSYSLVDALKSKV